MRMRTKSPRLILFALTCAAALVITATPVPSTGPKLTVSFGGLCAMVEHDAGQIRVILPHTKKTQASDKSAIPSHRPRLVVSGGQIIKSPSGKADKSLTWYLHPGALRIEAPTASGKLQVDPSFARLAVDLTALCPGCQLKKEYLNS